VVECLLCKYEALSSNSNPIKKKDFQISLEDKLTIEHYKCKEIPAM
jgi:hypothetical protein